MTIQATPAVGASLEHAALLAKRWLLLGAGPIWASKGVHQDGMFAEQIDIDGGVLAVVRRTRVQARQIYAFCELGRLGWDGDWRATAETGLDHLVRRGRRRDGLFIHSFSATGEPFDLRADLYDHAFVLFCLGTAAKVLGRRDCELLAHDLMDRLEQWRTPSGGFSEGEIDGPPRRQNPHMHMVEAALALWDVSHGERWKALARELASLSISNFIDPDSGAITEYFTSNWQKLPAADGSLVEPGHCCEWAWLFERLTAAGIVDGVSASDGLTAFARGHGIDRARGVFVNEIDLDLTLRNADARLWPQTERVKAALARFGRTREDCEVEDALAAFRSLQGYLDFPIDGLWHEVLRADATFETQPVRASSFYHIVCGLSELLRTAGHA